MPCNTYKSPDGKLSMIICTRGQRSKPCHICGSPSTGLCDYPIGNGKTCDKPMCNDCRNTIGDNLDVCQEHNNPRDIAITKEVNGYEKYTTD